jgi:transcriptional regulator with XRE-family HTH domain
MTQVPRAGVVVPVLRRVIGGELRRRRMGQGRTLREVSSAARVSLGYLSEVERGQKEASSELLASICEALEVPMSVVLRSVSDVVAGHEAAAHRGRIARLSEVSDRQVAAGDPVAPAA